MCVVAGGGGEEGLEIPLYKCLPGEKEDSGSPNECCLFTMFIDSN